MTDNPSLSLAVQAIKDEACAELRAEVERLRAEIETWGRLWNDEAMLAARVEALRDGTAQL